MPTTQAAIRDRAKALIEALTPSALTADRFRSSRNEGAASFEDWAEANPTAALRRFQVRSDGTEDPPEVSNADVDLRHATLVIQVAYPHTARYGADQALDRDDVIDLDWGRINGVIGIYGGANFPNEAAYACTPLGCEREIDRGTAVDILTIRMRFSHWRTVTIT